MEREFSIRSVFLPQGLTERTKDFILALGIAFVGCIGSYFILGGSIQNMMQTSATENTSSISYQKPSWSRRKDSPKCTKFYGKFYALCSR